MNFTLKFVNFELKFMNFYPPRRPGWRRKKRHIKFMNFRQNTIKFMNFRVLSLKFVNFLKEMRVYSCQVKVSNLEQLHVVQCNDALGCR
mgnify:CR=1 FL=1